MVSHHSGFCRFVVSFHHLYPKVHNSAVGHNATVELRVEKKVTILACPSGKSWYLGMLTRQSFLPGNHQEETMTGKIVHEIAELMCEKAGDLILERVKSGDDPMLILRGSLMYALISCELTNGASREEILQFVEKVYDILNQPAMTN